MGRLPSLLNSPRDYDITMLECMLCGYNKGRWIVCSAILDLETSSVYYEYQCPECDSMDIMINLSSEGDEPTTTR